MIIIQSLCLMFSRNYKGGEEFDCSSKHEATRLSKKIMERNPLLRVIVRGTLVQTIVGPLLSKGRGEYSGTKADVKAARGALRRAHPKVTVRIEKVTTYYVLRAE